MTFITRSSTLREELAEGNRSLKELETGGADVVAALLDENLHVNEGVEAMEV